MFFADNRRYMGRPVNIHFQLIRKIDSLSLLCYHPTLRFRLMPKILCIDDNSAGLRARRVLLEKMGHKVTTARSGQEGLKKFGKAKADLVIVDYIMPRMKGDQVLRKIKQADPKLPVILLSGYAETLGLEQAVPEADCVLNKGPREVPELTSAVTRLLRKRMKKPAASVKMKSAERKEKKQARR